jgi:hypothetical protein
VEKLGEIDISCGKTTKDRRIFEESIKALQDNS